MNESAHPPVTSTDRSATEQTYGLEGTGNCIVLGDNMEVIDLVGDLIDSKVKCIYLDPPYNNQESYAYYDDTDHHEDWLDDLGPRLATHYNLLSRDGSIWISIDDSHMHYVKVLCDKLIGRANFVATIVWHHRKTRENRRVFSFNHEYILVYAKDPPSFAKSRNMIPLTDEVLKRYKNPDNDPRGPWQSVSSNVQAGHATPSQFYDIISPTGKKHSPPLGRCWVYNEDKMKEEIQNGNVWFGKDGNGVPRIKKFINGRSRGLTPSTLWGADEVGTTREAKKHIIEIFPDDLPFDTPKPEQLLARIISIATNPNDLVLDGYLGSGTTAAVAHKMGRKYIGIEKDARIFSLCENRLVQVIDGESGGISKAVGWKGGGGFTSLWMH